MTASHRAGPRPDDALRCIARRLAEAIDHAIDRGMLRQADRLAANATRLAIHSSRLADRLARLRLAQDDPEAAMAIIDACEKRSASMRLLRVACLVHLGRAAEAHLELNAWSNQSTAPLGARRMLALLDAAAGDHNAAIAALTRNLQHVQDPASLELATILCAAEARNEQAEHWAKRLVRACIVNRATVDVQLLCESLNLSAHAQAKAVTPSPNQVATLAMELAASPESLPVLVQRQEQQLQPMVAQLVYSATEQALAEMEETAAGFEALARLARLLGRRDTALDWARRGLDANPMSAPLALLLAQLQQVQPVEPVKRKYRKRKAA